ncbi:hypothetical protein [Planomicrobium sp. CPCC 101110]|uniref:hypothetical protein n=1 Tax=Planomicrobium sp. CPCC 101110 TaxID=2599619 RepID=UPI0011B8C101|nr:hypothetical protein [Planomicrobium sp. CPCC 101110]TWT25888.1 hypothetical protein FQV30_08825 [Planomicrobium sp. CPCC 101110]
MRASMDVPEEIKLISFFGSKPVRKDKTEFFHYDTSTFAFENDKELFGIILSPFYDKFVLTVEDKDTKETLSYLELRSVQKLELVDNPDQQKIRLFHGESEIYQNVLEFTFNPRFKMVFEEQYR